MFHQMYTRKYKDLEYQINAKKIHRKMYFGNLFNNILVIVIVFNISNQTLEDLTSANLLTPIVCFDSP
jgi:hypothetical protein